jgi:hypothetical protein
MGYTAIVILQPISFFDQTEPANDITTRAVFEAYKHEKIITQITIEEDLHPPKSALGKSI